MPDIESTKSETEPNDEIFHRENNEDEDDVIFVSSRGPIETLPAYHDPSTGQHFCYGQDLDEF